MFAFFFFSLMIPRPPRSTLFPYTTVVRYTGELKQLSFGVDDETGSCTPDGKWVVYNDSRRSEEHTSELQSRRDLVCHLLLEKKKKKIKKIKMINNKRRQIHKRNN